MHYASSKINPPNDATHVHGTSALCMSVIPCLHAVHSRCLNIALYITSIKQINLFFCFGLPADTSYLWESYALRSVRSLQKHAVRLAHRLYKFEACSRFANICFTVIYHRIQHYLLGENRNLRLQELPGLVWAVGTLPVRGPQGLP